MERPIRGGTRIRVDRGEATIIGESSPACWFSRSHVACCPLPIAPLPAMINLWQYGLLAVWYACTGVHRGMLWYRVDGDEGAWYFNRGDFEGAMEMGMAGVLEETEQERIDAAAEEAAEAAASAGECDGSGSGQVGRVENGDSHRCLAGWPEGCASLRVSAQAVSFICCAHGIAEFILACSCWCGCG